MKPREENVGEIVDQHLKLFNAPSTQQIADAKRRTLGNLRTDTSEFVDEALDEGVVRRPTWRWRVAFAAAAAAGALLVVTLTPRKSDAHAIVQTSDGRTYTIFEGQPVRSSDDGTVLKLQGGAVVEMRTNSEVWLESDKVFLKGGTVTVKGQVSSDHIVLQTKDLTLKFAGSVSLVSAEEEGSRVAALQGEVRVQQQGVETKLLSGQQMTSNPAMAKLIQEEPTRPADTPKWDVVSVRPCPPGTPEPGARSTTATARPGGGIRFFPTTLRITCMDLNYLIEDAYVKYLEPEVFRRRWVYPVAGGPEWLENEYYSIEAKTEHAVSGQVMGGPMLQAILEDRFKLKLRREIREEPVYELRVADGGLKVQPLKDGECAAREPKTDGLEGMARLNAIQAALSGRLCGGIRIGSPRPGARTVNLEGQPLNEIGNYTALDRIVIDKTGIKGKFDLSITYDVTLSPMREPVPPPPDPSGAESIFVAIEKQLGLKLVPAKGPRIYYFVEHVERPTVN